MRALEAELTLLQADKAQLAKELQLARDETSTWKSKFEESRHDMYAVLTELRDRLPPKNSETATPAVGSRRNRHKR